MFKCYSYVARRTPVNFYDKTYVGFINIPKGINGESDKKVSATLEFSEYRNYIHLNKFDVEKLDSEAFFRCRFFGEFTEPSNVAINDLCHKFTFINCNFHRLSNIIEFEDFFVNTSYDDNNESFVEAEPEIAKATICIEGLKEFLWPDMCELGDSKSGPYGYLKEDLTKANHDDASYLYLHLLNLSETAEFKINNTDVSITFMSKNHLSRQTPAKNLIDNSSEIQITTSERMSVKWFKSISRELNGFLSFLCEQQLKVTKIYNFEKGKGTSYYDINKKAKDTDLINDEYFLLCPDISFSNLRQDLSGILRKWFDKYYENLFLISVIIGSDQQDVFSKISSQIQALETIGNIATKGGHTKLNIKAALDLINPEYFEAIFLYGGQGGDYQTSMIIHSLYGTDDINEIQMDTEYWASHLMKLRNFIIHPYIDGSLKNPKDFKELTNFCYDNGELKFRALGILSNRLNIAIKTIIYQQLGIDQFFDKIKKRPDASCINS